jgi:hypothetical protein
MLPTPAPTTPVRSTIIYHAADLDGKGSAAIALHALRARGEAEPVLLPIDYGWAAPRPADYPEGGHVYILDFSFDPVYMATLTATHPVTWIDHHSPRIRELAADGIPGRCVAAVLSDDMPSAAYLTWEHFHPDEPLPRAVADIDAWDATPDARRTGPHWDSYVRPFQFAMRLRDCSPAAPIWNSLLLGSIEHTADIYDRIMSDGLSICDYLDQSNRDLIPRQGYGRLLHLPAVSVGDADPYDGPVRAMLALIVNCHPKDPKDLLWHPLCTDAVLARRPQILITWGYEGSSGLWRLSISPGPADPTLDCGRIAKIAWGGGGHPGRAGATFQRMPLELLPYGAGVSA